MSAVNPNIPATDAALESAPIRQQFATIKSEFEALESGKQAALVSGTNIKTINGNTLLGSGDLTIVDSVNGRAGTVVLTSADVGLANVNNTSDASKPVSTAQAAADAAVLASANATTAAHAARTDNPHNVSAAQIGLGNVENKSSATIRGEITSGNVTTALGYTPENASQKGAAGGYAPLDGTGKVASAYLPSYVDDVLEFANLAGFPVTGESGKMYVALDTGNVYRWSGSAYVEIIGSPGSTDAVPEGASNLYFTAARVLATVLSGLSTATNAAITAADTVLSALGKLQKQISDNLATLTSHTSNTSNPHNATAAQVGAAASGAVTTSGLTMSTARLLGRNTASTGEIEEITLGTNLSFSGTTLNAFSAPTTAQVQAIFSASDLGLLYDVSDIATLYQDVAGATRITSLDQGVRRVSDMSGKAAHALYVSGVLPQYTRRCNQLVATDSFDDVAWTRVGTAPTVTPNAALNPWGVMTASQLAFAASGSGNRLNQFNAGNNNQRNTVSVYLKGAVGGEQIVIWNGWGDTLLCTLTTSWQRYALSETVPVGSTGLYIHAQSGTPTIYACGAMVNQGTTAAPYQSVTPTGVYDAAFWPYAVSMSSGSLTTTFSASLGSSCTVALARPRIGAEILTAQTIGTTYVDVFDYAARIIINRALTAMETALVTAWLNQKAGV